MQTLHLNVIYAGYERLFACCGKKQTTKVLLIVPLTQNRAEQVPANDEALIATTFSSIILISIQLDPNLANVLWTAEAYGLLSYSLLIDPPHHTSYI
jgi:hypothetical protein